jgi:hypothetical protein
LLRTLSLSAALLACSLVASVAPVAHAHITLKSPAKRPGGDIKVGPCTGAARGASPTVLEPGATIMVTWDETIQHPGHYRIAFDVDGEDFPVPAAYDDVAATLPFDAGNGVTILADDIMDKSGPIFGATPYEAMVTLPDVECETCTLQLIQMMTEKVPYGDGNDIYFECADIALRRTGGAPDAGMPMTTGGMMAPLPTGGTMAPPPPPPPPVAGMVAPTGGTGAVAGAMGGVAAAAGAPAPLPPVAGTPAMSGGDSGGCAAAPGRDARRTSTVAVAGFGMLALLGARRSRRRD